MREEMDTDKARYFTQADSEMESESRIRRDFEAYSKPREPTAFQKAFGIDPYSHLMHKFSQPIWEAELNQKDMEKRQKRFSREGPAHLAAMTFEDAEKTEASMWNYQTCPAEHFLDAYLTNSVISAVDYCLGEAEKQNIIEDHRAFKLFCPLDFIAEHLWMNNTEHLERRSLEVKQHPRIQPPLSLRLTIDEAAKIIQKRWKGTLTRRRPEIRALRRHMAAAKVQYGDPHKLVTELWDKEFQRAENLKHPETPCPCPKKYPPPPTPPKLPPYLQQMKAHIERKILEASQKHENVLESSIARNSDISSESDDACEPLPVINGKPADPVQSGDKAGSFSADGALPNDAFRKSQASEGGSESLAQNPASTTNSQTKKHHSLTHPDPKDSKEEPPTLDGAKKKQGKGVKPNK
ncbi:uncharacterized protein LOC129587262 isoform X2 [Paramacrobiotus metropolitanus]|uniref:uncharacterized protein LOC129587262 isoform X2 n=1 Tax=Paramacrobiotus metropolitanus TaxID=2943436 RepID=UPI002445D62D|nr:uncharacterized protein LOC129587262 isoform X2 [Paramacrobiotus metropolitanus]